jgi:hypothetical protein
MTDPRDTMRWVRRGIAIAALLFGWLFIGWQNHFHVTAPVVFICLGHLAVVATVYNLWRTGAVAVDPSDDDDDSTWARPAGERGELEREKRTLLKAIKEAEFDQQMGKLSQRDADEMIHGYRARAIEVLKEIDRLDSGAPGTVRDQILREVRARVLIESKAPRTAGPQAKANVKGGKRPARGKKAGDPASETLAGNGASAKDAGDKATTAAGAAAGKAIPDGTGGAAKDAGTGNARAEAADHDAPAPDAPAPAGAASAASGGDPGSGDARDEPDDAKDAPAVVHPRDEELDADSTTALEPRADERAKEATR